MAEISNNLIAGLLIVAILISIVGVVNTLTLVPVIRYTGAATTGTGKANVTIQSQVSITLLRNETLFGSGYTNTNTILYIATNQTNPWGDRAPGGAGSGYFNNGSEGNGTNYGQGTERAYPFVVENDGNDDTTCIKIYAAQTPAQWIGGSDQTPVFQFAGKNNESAWGSTDCAGTGFVPACTGTLTEKWTDVPTSASPATVCTALNSSQCTDELRIHFRIGLPSDTPEGGKQTTVTIQGTGSC